MLRASARVVEGPDREVVERRSSCMGSKEGPTRGAEQRVEEQQVNM